MDQREKLLRCIRKWRIERLERFRKRMLIKNGGKPIKDIEKIMGVDYGYSSHTKPSAIPATHNAPVVEINEENAVVFNNEENAAVYHNEENAAVFNNEENAAVFNNEENAAVISDVPSQCGDEVVTIPEIVLDPIEEPQRVMFPILTNWLDTSGKGKLLDSLKMFFLDESPLETRDFKVSFLTDVLADLSKIIYMGFSLDESERLLQVILDKSPKIRFQPIYRECENLITIMKNEDAKENEDTIDPIEEIGAKLATLELATPQKPISVLGTTSNIINSSVIEFSKIEKFKRNNEPEVFITPVRRSARKRKQTPGRRTSMAVQDLTSEMREKLDFKPNRFLY